MDLTADPAIDIERGVDDVLRVAATVEGPILLVGNSSGAVIALETVVADSSQFVAGALYEPPLVATPGGVCQAAEVARSASPPPIGDVHHLRSTSSCPLVFPGPDRRRRRSRRWITAASDTSPDRSSPDSSASGPTAV